MGSYTDEQVEEAYLFYVENNGNLSRTSRILSIPLATLAKWKVAHSWEARRKEDGASLALLPFQQSAVVDKLVDDFDISKNDAEVLGQVKKVEGVCFAVIEKNEEALVNIGLKPETFDQAMRALKVCWDTREKIFGRKDKGSDKEGDKKVNYIGAVIQNFGPGGNGETIISEESEMVPGKTIDLERRRNKSLE